MTREIKMRDGRVLVISWVEEVASFVREHQGEIESMRKLSE